MKKETLRFLLEELKAAAFCQGSMFCDNLIGESRGYKKQCESLIEAIVNNDSTILGHETFDSFMENV
jgi:hypothetical protein